MGNEKGGQKFREFALAFLKEAKEDLDVAEELFESKRFSRCVYFCQQCVEKSIKSLLELEKVFVAEHDLSSVFIKFIFDNQEYSNYKRDLENILDILNYFEGEWSNTRYPKEREGKVVTPIDFYNEDDAVSSIEKAKELYTIILDILEKKFNLNLKD